jgi:hypothetical protein
MDFCLSVIVFRNLPISGQKQHKIFTNRVKIRLARSDQAKIVIKLC